MYGPLRKRLISGGFWALTGKMGAMLIGLLVNALLARLLAPEELGVYFLVLSLVSFASVVSQFGLTRAIVRLVAESIAKEDSGRARSAVLFSMRIIIVIAAFVAVVMYMGAGVWVANYVFNAPLMTGIVGLISLMILVNPLQIFFVESFRAQHDVRMASILGGLITSTLYAILLVLVWIIKGSARLELVIALSLCANGLNMILAGYLLSDRIRQFARASTISYAEIVALSWPMWINNLAYFVLSQSDLWIVGIYLEEEAVALYGAAVRLMVLVTMPLVLVNLVVPSYISELHTTGQKARMEKMIRAAATLAAIPSVVVLSLMVVFGENLLSVIYGNYYSAAYWVLIILCFGQLINVLVGSCGMVLLMTGHQNSMMLITLMSGLGAIGSSVLVVDNYGVVGIAVSFSTAMAFQNLIMLVVVRIKTGVWTQVSIFNRAVFRQILGGIK